MSLRATACHSVPVGGPGERRLFSGVECGDGQRPGRGECARCRVPVAGVRLSRESSRSPERNGHEPVQRREHCLSGQPTVNKHCANGARRAAEPSPARSVSHPAAEACVDRLPLRNGVPTLTIHCGFLFADAGDRRSSGRSVIALWRMQHGSDEQRPQGQDGDPAELHCENLPGRDRAVNCFYDGNCRALNFAPNGIGVTRCLRRRCTRKVFSRASVNVA
jgi:hypothetical protein